jgi:hypothetical protein
MRVTIRKGVFETNSSSVHTLAISPDNYVAKSYPEKLKFACGEYGWMYEYLDSPEEKASYLWTYLATQYCKWGDNKALEEGLDLKQKIVDTLASHGIEAVFENVEEGTSYYDYGYVDHAYDWGDTLINIINDPDRLMTFLFDSNTYIVTCNDNDEFEDVDHMINESVKKGMIIFCKGN